MRQGLNHAANTYEKNLLYLPEHNLVGRVRAAALLCFLSKYNTMFCKCQVFFEKFYN